MGSTIKNLKINLKLYLLAGIAILGMFLVGFISASPLSSNILRPHAISYALQILFCVSVPVCPFSLT